MTRADARLRNSFASSCRDVTPPGAGRAARVLFSPFSENVRETNGCQTVLSSAERHQMNRLASERLQSRFVQRRAFRRYCAAAALKSSKPLSRLNFDMHDKGQPFLPGSPQLCFSFSSCRFGMLGAWSATHSVGVDIEDSTRSIEALAMAQAFFSSTEIDAIESARPSDRARIFYRLWSLKEAALKSAGQGLPLGLDAFVFDLADGTNCLDAPPEVCGPLNFSAFEINLENVSAAAVVQGR